MNKRVIRSLKILGTAIGIIIIAMLLLPLALKDKIGEIVKTEANNMLNAKVDFTSFDIGLFRHFPNASLSLSELSVSGIEDFEGDTLVSAKNIDIVVNLMSLFGDDGYEVTRIIIDNPAITAIQLANGKANWDIMKSDSTETETDTATTGSSFKLQLKNFSINEANLTYIDSLTNTSLSAEDVNISLSGNMSAKSTDMNLDAEIESVSAKIDNIEYLKEVSLKADINANADFENNKYTLQNNSITINAITLSIDGWAQLLDDGSTRMDINLNSSEINFKDILSLIPAIYSNSFDDLTATGELKLDAYAKGYMKGNTLPEFNAVLSVKNGKMSYKGLPKSIDAINIDATVNHPQGVADLTDLKADMGVSLANNPFNINLSVATPVSDPAFDLLLKGFIDLGIVKDAYPLGDNVKLNGKLTADLHFAGHMSDIEHERYERITGKGYLNITDMLYTSPSLPDINVNELALTVSSKALALNTLDAKVGKSDISANGSVSRYIPYLLNGGTLYGTLNISSSMLDLNELIAENTDSEAESEVAVENAASDTVSASGAIEIPKNLNLSLKSSFKEVLFQKIIIENLNGNISVKDGTLSMNSLRFGAFGGNVSANGSYSTAKDITKPEAALSLNVSKGDFKTTFEQLDMVRQLVPIFEKTGGTYSLDMKLQTTLDAEMNPDLNTLTASGVIQSNEINLGNIEVFNLLADKLNSNALKNISAVNVKIQFEIENGRVITSPFDLKVGGATLTLSGSTGLDQTIDYKTTIKLPEGSSVSEYVGSVSGNITGTFTKPVISLDMKSLAKEALKTTVSTQIEKLTGKNNEEQIAALREEADKAAEKLVEVARTEGQKLVDKASNPIAKIAAQAAAKKLEEEAQKQADALRAKAEEEIKKLEAATAE